MQLNTLVTKLVISTHNVTRITKYHHLLSLPAGFRNSQVSCGVIARSLLGSLSNPDREPREDKSLESASQLPALLLQLNTLPVLVVVLVVADYCQWPGDGWVDPQYHAPPLEYLALPGG